MQFQHLVSQRSGGQKRCAGGRREPGERGPLWSPLPCAAFPAGELLQSSPGCFWGISLTRAAHGSAGALEPVQLSWGLAGGDYLGDNLGRAGSVCGELREDNWRELKAKALPCAWACSHGCTRPWLSLLPFTPLARELIMGPVFLHFLCLSWPC